MNPEPELQEHGNHVEEAPRSPPASTSVGVHASGDEPPMQLACMLRMGTSGEMTAQEAAAYSKMKAFCSSIIQKLAPPLLREVQATQLRPEAEPYTPRPTTRAAKRTAQNMPKATPAENVLLQALGVGTDDLQVDDQTVQGLRDLFDSPLREQHVRIFAAIFGKALPHRDELERANTTAVLTR